MRNGKYPRCNLFNGYALMEQLTLNQRVQGSSPCAPTNKNNYLAGKTDRQETRISWRGNLWGKVRRGRQPRALGDFRPSCPAAGPAWRLHRLFIGGTRPR